MNNTLSVASLDEILDELARRLSSYHTCFLAEATGDAVTRTFFLADGDDGPTDLSYAGLNLLRKARQKARRLAEDLREKKR